MNRYRVVILMLGVLWFAGWLANATPIDLDIYGDRTIQNGVSYGWINIYDTPPDQTIVSMIGGEVFQISCYNTSNLIVTDGVGTGVWRAYDNSRIEIKGGNVSTLRGHDNSHLVITGGSISMLVVLDSSDVHLKGGQIGVVSSQGTPFHIYGYDLQIIDLPNSDFSVTGRWQDMTPFSITVSRNKPEDNVVILHEIPEPITIALLGFGILIAKRTVKASCK